MTYTEEKARELIDELTSLTTKCMELYHDINQVGLEEHIGKEEFESLKEQYSAMKAYYKILLERCVRANLVEKLNE